MCVWKNIIVTSCLLITGVVVQAEESSANSENKHQKHMVDMADGLNSQQFMNAKDPDALWSSTMFVPWKRTGAINAYQDNKPSETKGGVNAYQDTDKVPADNTPSKEENLAMPAASSSSGEITGMVDGKKIESDQLVNIRVMYGLDPEHTKAKFTPASSQNELFRQMSKYCSFGFQKVGEWSEVVEGSDYYLYYQFQCIEKREP
ncbi:MAG TPA: hypothetical protein VLB90_05435 [Pseudomonadales bacterium]|nr:hypothetical protein [Pseudomonadales bacterium]